MHARQTAPPFVIHSSRDLRPPVMQAAEIRHHGSAHHDVVKMRDDEVRIVHMHVHSQRGKHDAGQSARA